MKVKVPKMPVVDFLLLTEGLQKDTKFWLINQDIHGGYVRFRSVERFRLLQDILDYHNDGWIPSSIERISTEESEYLKKIGFDMKKWVATLENVTEQPNNQGFYRARCPLCPDGDKKGHGLAFNPDDNRIKCFRNECSYRELVAYKGEKQ